MGWKAGGEDLRHRPTRVVGDEVDTAEGERLADRLHGVGESRERDVAVGRGRAATVERQIERDHTPTRSDGRQDVAPEVRVGADSVDEERHGPGPEVEDADFTPPGGNRPAVRFEGCEIHTDSSPVR